MAEGSQERPGRLGMAGRERPSLAEPAAAAITGSDSELKMSRPSPIAPLGHWPGGAFFVELAIVRVRIRAMQLSPSRAGLAGRHLQRLPVTPASPTCSFPLRFSPSGQSDDQEHPSGPLLTVSGIQHRVPRRTVSEYPALQWPDFRRSALGVSMR